MIKKGKQIKKIAKSSIPTKTRLKTDSIEKRSKLSNERNKKTSQKSLKKLNYTEYVTEETIKSQKELKIKERISNDRTKPKVIKEIKKEKDKLIQNKIKDKKEKNKKKENLSEKKRKK